MCLWWLCLPRKKKSSSEEDLIGKDLNPEEQKEYEDVEYLAQKRDIKVTIRKSTQAGLAAGLTVMAGVLVAGPVGAAVGGAVGTALATNIAKDVVPLNTLLANTPTEKRGEILRVFRESFKEEFLDTIQGSPELKLMLGGMSIFGVVRYMMDREMIDNEQLKRMDGILRYVT